MYDLHDGISDCEMSNDGRPCGAFAGLARILTSLLESPIHSVCRCRLDDPRSAKVAKVCMAAEWHLAYRCAGRDTSSIQIPFSKAPIASINGGFGNDTRGGAWGTGGEPLLLPLHLLRLMLYMG